MVLPLLRPQELEQHQVKEVLSCESPPSASTLPSGCARQGPLTRPLTVPACQTAAACSRSPQLYSLPHEGSARDGHCHARAGLLHTIVFCRALGPVRPQEVDLQLFDITYVRLATSLDFGDLLFALSLVFALCSLHV